MLTSVDVSIFHELYIPVALQGNQTDCSKHILLLDSQIFSCLIRVTTLSILVHLNLSELQSQQKDIFGSSGKRISKFSKLLKLFARKSAERHHFAEQTRALVIKFPFCLKEISNKTTLNRYESLE